jgi:tetraacyldisaccharide 4'-kinase
MNQPPLLLSVIEGHASGPAASAILAVLTPFSWVYQAGLKLFLLPYRLGWRQRHKLPRRVVCVGNLTFGGTGKTPAVAAICRSLLAVGVQPAILTRGHGGRGTGSRVIMGSGSAELVGDEAAMLATSLPEVPIGVGKRREQSGLAVLRENDPQLFVLDDGLQYWQLHCDLNIVVVSAERPLGSGRVMPAGDLREPPEGIRRAGAVLIVGNDDSHHAAELIRKLAPKAELFHARRKPVGLRDVATRGEVTLDWLKGKKVCAMSGIGNPASFEGELKSLGAVVQAARRFLDHCRYSIEDVASVEALAGKSGCDGIITTAKDAIRIPERVYNIPMLVLEIELEIENMESLIKLVRPGEFTP